MTPREIALQVDLVIVVVASAIRSAQVNLAELGITSGFSFLSRSTGWRYSFSLIERSIDDPYSRTLLVGFLNTLFVGLTLIIIGTMRGNRKFGLQVISSVYVQIFRNIPLILQFVFLYAIVIHLPSPKQAVSLVDAAFNSNRGLMLPVFNLSLGTLAALTIVSSIAGIMMARGGDSLRLVLLLWIVGAVAHFFVAAFALAPPGESPISVPALKGLRLRGGVTLSGELLAMIVGIVL